MKYKSLIAAVVVSVLIRVLLGYFIFGGYHSMSYWELTADTFLSGKNVYAELSGYDYGSPWMLSLVIFKVLSNITHVPFFFMMKVPIIIADAFLVAALYFISPKKYRVGFAWAYALSPISIITTSIIVMFDSMAALFALLAVYLAARQKSMKAIVISAALLGLGAATKTYPLFFLPLIMLKLKTWTRRIVYPAVAVMVVFATTAPFILPDAQARERYGVLNDTVFVRSPPGMGYSKLFLAAEKVFPGLLDNPKWNEITHDWVDAYGNFVPMLMMGLVTIFVLPFLSIVSGAIILLTTFLFFTSGFGPHYVLWLVPFAIIQRERIFKWFRLASVLYLIPLIITWRVWLNPPAPKPIPWPLMQYISGFFAIILWLILLLWTYNKIKEAEPHFSIKGVLDAWLLRKKQ